MDFSAITKGYTSLQRRSLNNLFDTLILYQDCVERTSLYWAYQVGLNPSSQAASDQYRAVLKQGRDNVIKIVNQSLTRMEENFAVR